MKLTTKRILIGAFILALLMPMVIAYVQAQEDVAEPGELLEELGGAAGIKTEKTLPQIIGNIIKVILSFLGIVAVIVVIIGGFMWMTGAGDPAKVDKAKAMIKNGIIGIVIVVVAYAVATFIISNLMTIVRE